MPDDPAADPQTPPIPEPTPPVPPAEPPAPPTPDPATTPPAEPPAPQEPTAEDLRAQLVAKDEELTRLRSERTPPEPTPTPQPSTNQGIRHIAASHFIQQVIPSAKAAYVSDNATLAQQFDTIVDTTNKLVGAVMADQITPSVQMLAAANIELSNELEIRDLRGEVPSFRKELEPQVRAQLKALPMDQRAQTDAVRQVYYKVIGARSNGKAPAASPTPAPTPAPATRQVLKDVSAGGGAAPKPTTVRLTAAQEAERVLISDESEIPITPEAYAAKLKARQDRAKTLNKPVPVMLRDL